MPAPGARPGSASQVRVSSAKTASSAGDAGQRIGLGRAALPPFPADLVGDLLADLRAADVEVGDVLGRVIPVVGDRGRVEHADQLGEGPRVAVVRGGAGQQQRVGPLGQAPGEPVAEVPLADQVVRLVDDDRVPVHGVEVLAVPALVLERVDGDDDPLVVGERVAASRDLPLDPVDADRVQADERDREPGPQLELELLEDLLRGDDEDPVAAAAADQLGQDEADL